MADTTQPQPDPPYSDIRRGAPLHRALVAATPIDRAASLAIFVMRRMAAHGVDDAYAANALLGVFGLRHRRPLVLLRAMMLEIARGSSRTIMVAPCCCTRMTRDECRLFEALAQANHNPRAAHRQLAALTGNMEALGPLTCVQAVAAAFADLGQPLTAQPTA